MAEKNKQMVIPAPKTKSLTQRMVNNTAIKGAVNQMVDSEGKPTPAFQKAVMSVLAAQRPAVLAHLRRLRRKHPDDTPAQLADRLTTLYLRTLLTTGSTAGGVAFIPGVGTVASLGVSAVGVLSFLEITGLYAQGIAELNGIATTDDERGQALVMAVMLGEDGRRLLAEAAQGNSTAFAATSLNTLGGANWITGALSKASGTLFTKMRNTFMRRLVTTQSKQFLGRMVPFGVGAIIGGYGNRKLGVNVARSAQRLFGPMPTWDHLDELNHKLHPHQPKLTRQERKELKKLKKQDQDAKKRATYGWSSQEEVGQGVDREPGQGADD